MSDQDPFEEPDDTDKTVIRPNPGGRRPAPAHAARAAPPETAPAAHSGAPESAGFGMGEEFAHTGLNPLVSFAAPLFALISRIRNRAQHVDPERLRQSVVGEIRAFETKALHGAVNPQSLKVARYAICATIDDVVLNTPWGSQSIWAQKSMVGTFHNETVGGDRFYDLLARLETDPGNNLELLEFVYMCLSLGFEGRLRVEAGGADKHMQIRSGLAATIRRQRGAVERELSPSWQGLNKPHQPRSPWRPVWVACGVAALLMAISYGGLTYALSQSTNQVIGQLSVLDTGLAPQLARRAPPPPPPPPVENPAPTLVGFLSEEIRQGIVSVFEDETTITIRLSGAGMFASASDALQDGFLPTVARVAEALNIEPGPVLVLGHSDSQGINTARFPSNLHLSLARAEAVKGYIARTIDDPSRLRAEGRAAKEPIASNDTAAGRAKNRRIEIKLLKRETL